MRSTIGPYVAFIPGASATLDELDELAETHGDELNIILYTAYDDVKKSSAEGGFDKKTATKVGEVLARLSRELAELTKDAGNKVLDDQPQLKEQLDAGLDKLKELSGSYGPEAQKLFDQTSSEVKELMNQGVTPQSIAKAAKLVQEKTQKVKSLGREAAETAWDKGSKEAEHYLEKVPTVKKFIDENMDSIKSMVLSGGLSVSMVPQIFEKIKEAATGGDKGDGVDKLRSYFEDLAKQGKGKVEDFQGSDSWQSVVQMAEKYIKTIPGGEKVCCSSLYIIAGC